MEIDPICIFCNEKFKLIAYEPAQDEDNLEDILTFQCECGTHRVRMEFIEEIAEK